MKPDHLVKGDRRQQQSGEDEVARLDEFEQAPDDDHGDQCADATCSQQIAGREDRIADDVLHEGRHKRHGAEQNDADDDHEQAAGDEIPIAEQLEANEWRLRGERMSEEEIEGGRRDHRFDHDLVRVEPAKLLAAIKHQLQRADRDREREEAEPVEATQMRLAAAFRP